MKFENNNKDIIKKITKRSLKANKIRNIFAVIAIVLTTFMISAIFTLAISYAKNYQIMNLRDQGTTATTFLANPTDKQIKEIENLDISKNIGQEINVGNVSKESLDNNKTNIFIKYLDKENWENQLTPCISGIKGNYPTKENEIMLSKLALEFLNKENSKIGDKIKISYDMNGKTVEKEFILSGYFTSYDYIKDSGYMFVSEKFVYNKNLSLEKNGQLLITLQNNKKAEAPNLLKSKVSLNENQKFEYNYDAEEDSNSIKVAAVIIGSIIGAFIVISGYLIIYNILYIAVTKNIQFYGLLKTIGTSPKQIKKIVKLEGLKLSIIGIPIGIILAVIVSYLIVPLALEGMASGTYYEKMMENKIYFEPIVFILSILFSLFTVLISCKKPSKIASSISPIEAMKYSGQKTKKEKKNRNSTKGGKLYKMAWYNVFRDKKRAILVFLSLFMGIMAFLGVNTFINSVSVENYANRYLNNDFELQAYYDDNSGIDNKVINEIEKIEGINSVETLKASMLQMDMNEKIIKPLLKAAYERHGEDESALQTYLDKVKKNPSEFSPWVVGVEDKTIERFNEENEEKIDLEAFKNGKLALIESFYYSKGKELDFSGKKITLKNADKNKTMSFNTRMFFNDESGILSFNGSNVLGVPTIYVSSSALNKLDKNLNVDKIYIDVDDKYDSKVKSKLKTIASESRLVLESKTDKIESFNKSSLMMNVVGGGISIILIFIGLLNFINVMVTNVNVRLQELAIMESIGMTKKQIKKMLTIEGAYYASITTLLTCTLGMGMVYLIAQLTKNIADYAEFVFPGMELISLITLIFTVCLITPVMAYKYSSKKTVTERLREIEK
ncbi:MAG: FtsX-like permease family protein [Terrisporobacter othiniensis]|uniref:ABC transporter permease n=1 Tax=Terrisporobacter othiniensis TaxID=1577792 RepID=UPI000938ED70|nr:ABC transporter permease [Terrisporobacter othiniensis]MDU6985985.1 FtsX-like permease family protein [Terrisporobacter othiniensis]